MKQMYGYPEALETARFLAKRWAGTPQVAIVLGSGLGGAVQSLERPVRMPYRGIPHFPIPGVPGHSGTLHLGRWGEVEVAILEGRSHLYEGRTPAEVVFPVRALALAGVATFVFTCAAGGMAPRAVTGGFMIFSDHLNLLGSNALAGTHDPNWGQRFLDLSEAYDRRFRKTAREAARALRLRCFEGVYAALPGPSFETPAEIRALRRLGADAVGMSTVPEVIAARQRGARVLAIAAVTNRAAGLSRKPLAHEGVQEAGKKASEGLRRLLDRILPELAKR